MPHDQRIIEALKVAGVNYDVDRYNPSSSFRDNGLDSLDVMSLLLAVEERHGVKFFEGELDGVRAPDDITSLLDDKLANRRK